jgi:hypothetical protein
MIKAARIRSGARDKVGSAIVTSYGLASTARALESQPKRDSNSLHHNSTKLDAVKVADSPLRGAGLGGKTG